MNIKNLSTINAVVFGLLCAGVATAEDVQVNTYTTGQQNGPSVEVGAGGDFVVVWASEGSSGTDISNQSIQGQRYAPARGNIWLRAFLGGLVALSSDPPLSSWAVLGRSGWPESLEL